MIQDIDIDAFDEFFSPSYYENSAINEIELIESWIKDNTNLLKNDYEINESDGLNYIDVLSYELRIINYKENTIPSFIQFRNANLVSIESCNLKNLRGIPTNIQYHLFVVNCKNLEYLSDNIEKVGLTTKLYHCDKLKTLEGFPKSSLRVLVEYCKDLKSLKGIENSYIEELQLTSLDSLNSLQGCPDTLNKLVFQNIFNIQNCKGLENIKNLDTLDIYCCYGLTSLKGCPKKINVINIKQCKNLKSLMYGPSEVGVYQLKDLKNLESLKGCPEKLNSFYCVGCNNLKTLKYGPSFVYFDFIATFNPLLDDLENLPKKVHSISYYANKRSISKDELKHISYNYCRL